MPDPSIDPNRTVAAPDAPEIARWTAPPGASVPFPALPGYDIFEELGRGGMGVVYKARQLLADREVAVKMILGPAYAGSVGVARFRAEAVAVSRLQHPNIIAIHEVGEHDGSPFFSMEYCPRGSLAGLTTGVPLSPRPAAELVARVAHGVAAAHAAGVVHRDLKPGNVLLAADGQPKVADFGLAKLVGPGSGEGAKPPQGELTATGAVLGTPAYMAPEQASGAKHVGPAADVYALGAMLYEFLTGAPPFRGATAADTLLLLLTEDPRPPRSVVPAIPVDLEAICLHCLDKDPSRRYPSARELADDLGHFIAGEAVSAVRSGVLGRVAGAMGRGRLHDIFTDYSNLMLAWAPVMLLPEILITMAVWNGWPLTALASIYIGRILAYLLVLGYFRNWNWLPVNASERQLYLVWGGYIASYVAFGLGSRVGWGKFVTSQSVNLYPGLAALTGLAFFSLASNFWGYFALIGVSFFILPFVMAIDLNYAPIEFGALWAAVLLLLGWRLRRVR